MEELLAVLSPGEAPGLSARRVAVTLIDLSPGHHRVPDTAAGYPAFRQTIGGKGQHIQVISIHINRSQSGLLNTMCPLSE